MILIFIWTVPLHCSLIIFLHKHVRRMSLTDASGLGVLNAKLHLKNFVFYTCNSHNSNSSAIHMLWLLFIFVEDSSLQCFMLSDFLMVKSLQNFFSLVSGWPLNEASAVLRWDSYPSTSLLLHSFCWAFTTPLLCFSVPVSCSKSSRFPCVERLGSDII